MTPLDFVKQIRNTVVEENISLYKDHFTSTNHQNATDPHWKQALKLHDKLDHDDQKALFDLVRQVMVDTISNIFAVLDGVTQLDGQNGGFRLVTNSTSEPINGQLQDRFLELEENGQISQRGLSS